MPKTQKTKTPQLRFPEFSGEWEEKKIKKIYDFRKSYSFSRNQLNYEEGKIKNIHYGDVHTKYRVNFDINNEKAPFINKENVPNKIKQEDYCKEGDVIIADASEDYKDVGKAIELINLNNEKFLSGLHTFLLRKNNDINLAIGFSGYLMKSNTVRKKVMKIATGASILGISKTNFSKLKVNTPSLPEQQKIASFLTKVDEWIDNLKQQKEKLEEYKKGIMQKIFSQEIRFRDDNGEDFPNWEKKRLGEVCDYKNGGSFEKNVVENGKYNLISLNSININGDLKDSHKTVNSADWFLEKGDLVMVLSDVAHGDFLGLVDIIPKDNEYVLNQRMGLLRVASKNIDLIFLRFYINNKQKYFKRHGQGSSQQNLSKGDILKFLILTPLLKEQQKIADFLTSIDKTIELKQEQIFKAENWKKGLMQKMFV